MRAKQNFIQERKDVRIHCKQTCATENYES